jgi:transglutaminase-like putative cysteine protease
MSNKLFLSLTILFTTFSSIFCVDETNKNINIDSLANEADAVILEEDINFIITDLDHAEYTISKKILIKNKNADNYCTVVARESEFIITDDIDAVIKDLNGEVIKELDDDDIKEAEASLSSFYSGDYYKWFQLTHHTYPYIFEYRIKKEYKSLFFFPDWFPQSTVPVFKSTYKLTVNDKIEFDYFEIGEIDEPVESNSNYGKTFTWTAENLPKIDDEDFMPPENKNGLGVLFRVIDFSLGEYAGSAKNWNEFANFYNRLTKDRYELPQKAKTEISRLIKNKTNKREIVRLLYEHLQDKTRYVAIEMGIRGWQPQSAAEVYKNKYGDCKDLSTYMVAMLEHAGIKAYPALALTRNKGTVYEEFPTSQFNHCIAVVPFEQDTIWLECTSSYANMDNTPYTIEDINALVVTKSGGKLIRTPKKISSQNFSKSIINGKLNITGHLNFEALVTLGGNQENSIRPRLEINDEKDDKLFLQNLFSSNFSNLTINNYSINDPKSDTSYYSINLVGVYNKFSPVRGKRIFINPNIYNKATHDDLPDEEIDERDFPVYYYYPYLDVDSVSIELPKQFKVESVPKNVFIENSFVKYISNYFVSENKISYSRHFEIKDNLIPVEKYEEYLEFLRRVIKTDKSKFVLTKSLF